MLRKQGREITGFEVSMQEVLQQRLEHDILGPDVKVR
jgi:hypothetical protein